MIEQSAEPCFLNKDFLPLYIQANKKIKHLKTKNTELSEKVAELQLQILDMESNSVEVKSVCARCMNQSLDQSHYETDSKLYQKIFEKNLSESEGRSQLLFDKTNSIYEYHKTKRVKLFLIQFM
jgi:hypothetical protein